MSYIWFMEKEENIQKFVLRIDKNLKKDAEKLAKESNRSLNGYILHLIQTDQNPSSISVNQQDVVGTSSFEYKLSRYMDQINKSK